MEPSAVQSSCCSIASWQVRCNNCPRLQEMAAGGAAAHAEQLWMRSRNADDEAHLHLPPSCRLPRLNLRSIISQNGWVSQSLLCAAPELPPPAPRLRCPRLLTSPHSLNSPGLYRRNNVPHWQRMHQTHDGLRQWQKGPRAKFMLYPYYALLASTSAATMYMMGRMVLVRQSPIPTSAPRLDLTPGTGTQDLVLQQLDDCLLYITAIELLHAKSKIPTTKQLHSIFLFNYDYTLLSGSASAVELP